MARPRYGTTFTNRPPFGARSVRSQFQFLDASRPDVV
jgi:hypothetical protein